MAFSRNRLVGSYFVLRSRVVVRYIRTLDRQETATMTVSIREIARCA